MVDAKGYPIGQQDFKTLRNFDYLYIDKAQYIERKSVCFFGASASLRKEPLLVNSTVFLRRETGTFQRALCGFIGLELGAIPGASH